MLIAKGSPSIFEVPANVVDLEGNCDASVTILLVVRCHRPHDNDSWHSTSTQNSESCKLSSLNSSKVSGSLAFFHGQRAGSYTLRPSSTCFAAQACYLVWGYRMSGTNRWAILSLYMPMLYKYTGTYSTHEDTLNHTSHAESTKAWLCLYIHMILRRFTNAYGMS